MCWMCNISDFVGSFFHDTLGLPTMAELSGAEDAKREARAQRREAAKAQLESEQERIQAAERRRMNIRSATERRARGRASTILTGPGGVTEGKTQTARSLLPN